MRGLVTATSSLGNRRGSVGQNKSAKPRETPEVPTKSRRNSKSLETIRNKVIPTIKLASSLPREGNQSATPGSASRRNQLSSPSSGSPSRDRIRSPSGGGVQRNTSRSPSADRPGSRNLAASRLAQRLETANTKTKVVNTSKTQFQPQPHIIPSPTGPPVLCPIIDRVRVHVSGSDLWSHAVNLRNLF